MAYGQKNYNQPIGGGRYTIRQVGCFLTAFSNLLERFGRGVDPLTLNRVFTDRGIFIDVDDGVRDDLGWQSITAYDGQITLKQIGTGTPPSQNCIVKISDSSNQFGTHFCLVDHIQPDGEVYVVDSWDGQVKSALAYGPVVQWAEYGNSTPQPVAVAAPQPVPPATGEVLNLPAVPSWRVYRTDVAWIPGAMVGKECAKLAPEKFGGLTYDVLGHPYQNVVTIKTRDYGVVNIYVGPETGATITAPPPPAPAPTPVPEPSPVPEPPQPTPPQPEPQPSPAPEPVTPSPQLPTEATITEQTEARSDGITDYDTSLAGDYIASKLAIVKDMSGDRAPLTMPLGVHVTVAGTFKKDGITYYRTKKSALPEYNWWYGIPVDSLRLVVLDNPPSEEDDDDDDSIFDMQVVNEARDLMGKLSARERLVAFVAGIYGIFQKLKVNIKRSKA